VKKTLLDEKIKLALDGDEKSYSDFLTEVSMILRKYLTKKIFQSDDREDVLQEILLSIHKARHTFDCERPVKPWVMAIATYRINDYLRAHYKKKENEVTDFDSISNFFEQDVTNSGVASELESIVNTLPEKQKKIVYMMKIEGYSVKEVAAAMGMSESAIKVSAHRSYKLLRKKMEQLESDY